MDSNKKNEEDRYKKTHNVCNCLAALTEHFPFFPKYLFLKWSTKNVKLSTDMVLIRVIYDYFYHSTEVSLLVRKGEITSTRNLSEWWCWNKPRGVIERSKCVAVMGGWDDQPALAFHSFQLFLTLTNLTCDMWGRRGRLTSSHDQ